jgi:para-nitrobenzyl esterase
MASMQQRNAACVLLALASMAASAHGAGLEPAVRVAGGLAAGVPGRDAAITVFKGLPFAAPPVGDLRWRAPRPVVTWTGVRKADRFGANCMQTTVEEKKPWTYEFMAHGPVSEDCLFLNVWTGARDTSEKRPVYVYVHGGANTEGSGSVPVYDGEGLARKGIVV